MQSSRLRRRCLILAFASRSESLSFPSFQFGHVFQLKEGNWMLLFVLNSDAGSAQLHMGSDQTKRFGRRGRPLLESPEARPRQNKKPIYAPAFCTIWSGIRKLVKPACRPCCPFTPGKPVGDVPRAAMARALRVDWRDSEQLQRWV